MYFQMTTFPNDIRRLVVLLDPSDEHITLDTEGHACFFRCSIFSQFCDILHLNQIGQIDLHVPSSFNLELMRQYARVYIHTYFVGDETPRTTEIEREKIRDSIRLCCDELGIDNTKRGVGETNQQLFSRGIELAAHGEQMDRDRMNRRLQQHD
jgi:hypothetical protein